LNRPPEALLLDALGTLVALEPPAPRLRRVLSDGFGVSVSEPDAERAIAAEMAHYRSHLDEGRDDATLAALRRSCAQAMGAALPSGARERLDPDALTSALLRSLEFSVFDDVRPALRACRDRGRRIVVVSNWDISLTDVLGRLELTPWLEGIVTSAAVGARKPAAQIFERGLELAGVDPSHAVHVGDGVVEDVEGARRAGIEAILLRRDHTRGPPGVRTINSLEELEAAIEGLPPAVEP
jgi:putative hydrolase of the HAD superfamily